MLKSIVGVIVSYAIMFVFFMAVFSGSYSALASERVFQADSYEISSLWIRLTIVLSLLGSMIGGYLCAAISKSKRTCQVFAFIVFFLSLLACLPALKRNPDAPNVRAGEVSNLDARRLAVMPLWLPLVNSVTNAAGVLLGARIKRRGNA